MCIRDRVNARSRTKNTPQTANTHAPTRKLFQPEGYEIISQKMCIRDRYYQVALTVRDENTLKRELRPLTAVKDRYPKFVLTLDDDPEMQYDGISRMNARDRLPEKTD